MNITKGDVQELRRRLKKTECTFGRLCGCYVNSGKQIVTKFTEQFSELEEDEYYKYLEIAKKTFSGTLGANLLELEFDRSDSGIEHQKYLLTLKDSKLANEELLDRLYEQVIEEYSYPGNYLIVVYHDVYDVPSKATSGEDQDESTELYAYCVCAVCPVELAKPALGYREDENRIGARERGFLGRMLFSGDDVYKPVRVLSGGEKVRLMLARMMLFGSNVLVIDQPTNHLDLESITAVNNGVRDFKGTVLFASHDHEFVQTIATRIIEIREKGVLDKECTYDEFLEFRETYKG